MLPPGMQYGTKLATVRRLLATAFLLRFLPPGARRALERAAQRLLGGAQYGLVAATDLAARWVLVLVVCCWMATGVGGRNACRLGRARVYVRLLGSAFRPVPYGLVVVANPVARCASLSAGRSF